MELLLGQLAPPSFHAAGLHDDGVVQFGGVTLGQIPQRVAYTQKYLRARISRHVTYEFLVFVEVEAARAAAGDEAVDHIDERRAFALQVVGQQSVYAPLFGRAVEPFERGGEVLLIDGEVGHVVA